jgi:hypothetical protein
MIPGNAYISCYTKVAEVLSASSAPLILSARVLNGATHGTAAMGTIPAG